MPARKRDLKPDNQGRYRPRIGWEMHFVNGAYVGRRQPRFNLGSDKKEAERRYARLLELYDDNCRANGEDVWSPLAISYAREVAKGVKVIEYPPLDDPQRFDDPATEYAQMIEVNRRYFPSLTIVPSDPALHAESLKRNETLVSERLRELEAEMKETGAITGKTGFPDKLIVGTMHEALDAYAAEIRRDGQKLVTGVLKPYQRLRLCRVDRLKREHADFALHLLSHDKCAEMVAHWRNRPMTLRGTPSSRDNARHHLSELFRFFRWLDATDKFQWTMPRGVQSLSRKVPKHDSEKKLTAVTKVTYSPEQLALLNKHANPLERLALYLGLNCAMGAAELGRLVEGDFFLLRAHQFADKLGFDSTNEDSFLSYFRPKTEVFGEWLLWPETVQMVQWGVARAKRLKTDLLFVWDTGKPMYVEALANPQSGFANVWNRLIKRVHKSDKSFPPLPFGTLRDTLPDVLRHKYSDDLASLGLAHGSPSKADSLLECYANKPFGRLHNALRQLRNYFAPVFNAVKDPLVETKHYLPVAVKEKIHAMLAEGKGATEIARACGVSTMTVYRERKSHPSRDHGREGPSSPSDLQPS